MSDSVAVPLTLLLVFALVGGLWVLPITLGIRTARAKNRSPHWMWFAFHPVGGWIVFAILRSLPALKVCPQCSEKVKAHAKICPYCMTAYGPNPPFNPDPGASAWSG